MSGFGGFGGFGSNNQAQKNTGFTGFGSNNTNTAPGFGQTPNTGFGATPNNAGAGGSIFGSGGFGSNATATTPFGGAPSPAFGSAPASGGGIFGNSTAAAPSGTGFGGFGTNNTSSPFGAGATPTPAGLFGQPNKPTFGNTPGGNIFGGGGSPAFGSGATANTGTGATIFGNGAGTALGGNVAECQGTGSTPFQAYTEKDGPSSSHTNHFQSISCMAPYQKYSFEELRLADYNQGRKFGNGSGQAGAFGATSFGGGFGQQTTQTTGGFGTGMFGNNAATSASPFGATTATTGGFGNNQAGSLFGAGNKTTTNLFGGNTNATPANTGSIFGGGGFGANQQQPTSSIFGNNAAAQQKPAGIFGNTTTAASNGFGSSPGFGNTNNASGGVFGNNQTQNASPFGPTQQQQTTASPFGATNTNSGFGGFGTNQSKPAGGNLFGNNAPIPSNGGLFGNNNTNQQQPAGGVFGNQPKPSGGLFGNNTANTGGGVFGNTSSPNTTAGGGLFGNLTANNPAAQNQGTNLFGNNNAQAKPSPFGNTMSGTTLFGGATGSSPNANGGSLFGNAYQAQPAAGSFGAAGNASSIFGNSQQNALQPPSVMTASVLDQSPYGSASIFSGLPAPPPASPGPIATPISAGVKTRKPAVLPQYKINPAMASRLVTPQKPGYGFSYSTYGTPSSASSVTSTPGGFGSSLLNGSFGKNLGKSLSTSNLRTTIDGDGDSILSPGAFSASSTRYVGSGSMKKLTIDRSLRTDLFGNSAPAALPSSEKQEQQRFTSSSKKKVSFDASTNGGAETDREVNGSAINEPSATPTAQEQGYLRPSGRANGNARAADSTQPEREQVKGNELAIVHEEDASTAGLASFSRPNVTADQSDPEPGEYYTQPPISELKKLPLSERKRFSGFRIGRKNCGYVDFNEPVDLTAIDLDDIPEVVATIDIRSLTIYPHDVDKPPVGKGLNVPSTITLGNSWPRGSDRKTPTYEKGGPRFDKHITRLKKVVGTEFVKYNKDTGEWTFRVPHFTTYGFDYEEDEDSEVNGLQNSVMSEAPPTPTPKPRLASARATPMHTTAAQASPLLPSVSATLMSVDEPSHTSSSGPEDTFGYKKGRIFPGSFDGRPAYEDDVDEHRMVEVEKNDHAFLGQRSALSDSEHEDDEPSDVQESNSLGDNSLIVREDDMEMAGRFPAVEPDEVVLPKSILKAGQWAPGTPGQPLLDLGDDWADQLRRTVSPRKQDRQALRASQAVLFKDQEQDPNATPTTKRPTRQEGEITTSIDLMNSLFGKEEARRTAVRGAKQQSGKKGFEWPYNKRSKDVDQREPSESQIAFHNSFKPRWGPRDVLLHPAPVGNPSIPKGMRQPIGKFSSESRDIESLQFERARDITPDTFARLRDQSSIGLQDGVPYAKSQFKPFNHPYPERTTIHEHESKVWEMLSILFDRYEDEISTDVPDGEKRRYEDAIRKDRFSAFWSRLCEAEGTKAVAAAPNGEERAIAYLSMNKVPEACKALIDGKNYRLATLVAQVGGDGIMRDDMRVQIDEWKRLNVISEMSDPIRALYEVLAGSTCVCEGKKGPLEDRAKTFTISERFGLDWRRAFGLKLWYGVLPEDPLSTAVRAFESDLQDKETRKPVPSFVETRRREQGASGRERAEQQRQDILWGVLKLFGEEASNRESKLIEVVMPENVAANPLHHRLSFELYHALGARYGAQEDEADRLVRDFGAELEAADEWLWALWTLLHLSNADQRRKAVQDTLARFAPAISGSDEGFLQAFFADYQIPEAWLWDAKALYARSAEGNHGKEVAFLARGGNWTEAHRVLCEVVAPQAIIERNYPALQGLLGRFPPQKVAGWGLGGQVYADYLALVAGGERQEKKVAVTKRLLRALAGMAAQAGGRGKKRSFVESVALQEMGAVVGEAALEFVDDMEQPARVLQLPLTPETKAGHAMDLSLKYYRALMAQQGH